MKKTKSHDGDKLARVFGLIARSAASSQLVLSHSRITVGEVITTLQSGADEQAVFAAHPGIRPEEIRALKAYLVRFGPDLETPLPLPDGPKALLLDENIPYTLIPAMTKHFGVSSHVEAEGLSRQNLTRHSGPVSALDGRIARYAGDNGFAALITADTDFAALYKYPTHPVRAINVILLDGLRPDLTVEKRILRHQDMIRKQLASPQRDLIRI